MKITIGHVIVAAVQGPGANANWRKLKKHVVSVTAQPYKISKKRPITHSVPASTITSPFNAKAECDAWKALDAHYSNNRSVLGPLWRPATGPRGISTYDAYMAYAMPHTLRGISVPSQPPPAANVPWPAALHRLQNPTPAQLSDCVPPAATPVPPSCQTHGLEIAEAWTSHQIYLRPPPYINRYACYYYIQATDLDRPVPDLFFYRTRLAFQLNEKDVGPWSPWYQASGDSWSVLFNPSRIAGLQIDYAPPQRYIDGQLCYPPLHDPQKIVEVRTLTTAMPFTHWPRRRNWPRGKRLPVEVTDFTDPIPEAGFSEIFY